jgi:hypothetical protein
MGCLHGLNASSPPRMFPLAGGAGVLEEFVHLPEFVLVSTIVLIESVRPNWCLGVTLFYYFRFLFITCKNYGVERQGNLLTEILLSHVFNANMPVRQYASTPVRQYDSMPVCQYASTANMPVQQYASTPVRQYASTASTPVCQYASMPVQQYASMPVCQYDSMPVRPVRQYDSMPVCQYGQYASMPAV